MIDSTAKRTKTPESKRQKSGATDEETLSDIEETTELSESSSADKDEVPAPGADVIDDRKQRNDGGPI